ncbi:hypothetical protein QYM36_001435 [Artemia franciscana]|uniref:Uncharacterized protein n=1 Tax=Artemia franciscana TaxID=6661 RepID=A0AA88LK76_ARTSF|nr:hypothetical protein QYM36_001435 [Artemia franciscana]
MLTDTPANSAGGASPSRWVNQELFLEYIKHFKTYSHASTESSKLLIMDNDKTRICSAVCERRKSQDCWKSWKSKQRPDNEKKLFVDSEGSDDEKMILDDDNYDSMKLGELEDESEKEEEIFDSVSTGDFVKVVYKGEYFPGSVQQKNKNSVRVSVTCMTGLRKWKWLDQEDLIFYPREDILKKLLPPTPAPGTASREASYFVFADW